MVNDLIILDEKKVWDLLNTIPDPDIPALSIVDLGLVRKVEVAEGNNITVTLTPSYSGCPAMHVFSAEVIMLLKSEGANEVNINIALTPAWTTAWLSKDAKKKLQQYGIAPPEDNDQPGELFFKKQVTCPHCLSTNTKRTSEFGSTPCKALWYCNHCQQPFEYFKCH